MSWPLCSVSELCEFAVDCVNKTAPVVDQKTPYKMIRTTNVKGGFIDIQDVRCVTKDTFEKWTRRSRPRYGDVVLTREAPVGEVGRCTFSDDENIFLGQRLFHYRPDPEKLDWNFLAYVLQSPEVQGRFHGRSFGATVPHVKVGDAESLLIPCPPLEEQRRIGRVLANYDDLIATNQRRIALLEDAARRLYREWFVHLRFPGHETVPVKNGVPLGWRQATLGHAMFLQRGFDLPSGDRFAGDVPVYASTGLNGFHNQTKVAGPGVVTGRSGTLGLVHYVPHDFWPLNTSLWVKEFRAVSPLLGYFMLSELHLEQFNSGASVPTLDRKVAHQLPVLIPARSVVAAFDAQIQPLFDQIHPLKAGTDVTARARDLLLPKLMSGQLDVSSIPLPDEVDA
jgi:type I restriction enzyme, S subunit